MGKKNKSSLETRNNTNQSTKKYILEPNSKHRDIFFTILFYCILIIASPILTFFLSKQFIYDTYFEPVMSNIWAAISAVLALHIALGAFLYRAYFSNDTEHNRKED